MKPSRREGEKATRGSTYLLKDKGEEASRVCWRTWSMMVLQSDHLVFYFT